MAVTLAQATLLTQNKLQRGVLETFVQESPILDRLPLIGITGNNWFYNEELTLPGIEFRAVNAAYSESTGTVVQKSEKLVILGGDADVDTFIEATGSEINGQRATQTAMKVKAASMKFSDAYFNGNSGVDVNSFDGLKVRLIGNQVISMGTNGGPIVGNGTTDADAFLDKLDLLLRRAKIAGPNGALYASSSAIDLVRNLARRKGLLTDGGMVFGTTSKALEYYRGTPIFDPGQNPAGADILPQTETQGTSTDCSSIYAVRYGTGPEDQAVTGLFNKTGRGGNGVFDVRDLGELQTKPAYRTRVEGFVGVAIFGGKAAARLSGVRPL